MTFPISFARKISNPNLLSQTGLCCVTPDRKMKISSIVKSSPPSGSATSVLPDELTPPAFTPAILPLFLRLRSGLIAPRSLCFLHDSLFGFIFYLFCFRWRCACTTAFLALRFILLVHSGTGEKPMNMTGSPFLF
ncbi:unnamed protein product [Orchesella dallaii]|uniref:Uncharacterized protein n=1 Tax=Orchesella dallaii TaxID=48710 RepID=A0ABP1RUB4_9HEXA